MPGFESLSFGILVWVFLVIALAGWVQGALGLGFPMLATPLIAAVSDMRTAVILILLPCLACVATNIARTGSLRPVLAQFWMMPFYMMAGSALGTRIFIAHPAFPYTLLLAGMILVYLNLERLGKTEWPPLRRHRKLSGAAFGVMAGLAEGTANIAAPPLVIYYLALGATPETLVQGLNICFFTGKATQFTTFVAFGGVEVVQWVATLPLAVVACLTTIVGVNIRNRIDASAYRMWLKRALFAMAVVLCAQFIYAAARG